MCQRAVLDIAGICYALEKAPGGSALDIGPSHARFLSDREPELCFRAVDGAWPALQGLQPSFDPRSWWSMSEAPGARVISFFDTVAPRAENRRAVFSPDFRSGTVYCLNPLNQVFPLSYPLEELIYINVLPSRGGAIIHACGAGDARGGYLFVGVSGAGKSTISKVLMKGTDWQVLSDNRIILRRVDGAIRMFGTPWHGEVDVCENLGIPLRRIFFLKQAPANRATRWSPAQTATALLARSFPPFWDREGMESTTSLCIDVASQVPCYELGFLPDASVLECLAGIQDA